MRKYKQSKSDIALEKALQLSSKARKQAELLDINNDSDEVINAKLLSIIDTLDQAKMTLLKEYDVSM